MFFKMAHTAGCTLLACFQQFRDNWIYSPFSKRKFRTSLVMYSVVSEWSVDYRTEFDITSYVVKQIITRLFVFVRIPFLSPDITPVAYFVCYL